jgi:hypothetical protein
MFIEGIVFWRPLVLRPIPVSSWELYDDHLLKNLDPVLKIKALTVFEEISPDDPSPEKLLRI